MIANSSMLIHGVQLTIPYYRNLKLSAGFNIIIEFTRLNIVETWWMGSKWTIATLQLIYVTILQFFVVIGKISIFIYLSPYNGRIDVSIKPLCRSDTWFPEYHLSKMTYSKGKLKSVYYIMYSNDDHWSMLKNKILTYCVSQSNSHKKWVILGCIRVWSLKMSFCTFWSQLDRLSGLYCISKFAIKKIQNECGNFFC